MTTRTIDFRLRPDPRAAASAREALRRDLGGELGGTIMERAELLVSELVTNSVRHAGLRPGQEIKVSVRAQRGYLWASVSDPGNGFHPHVARPGTGDSGGLGMYLVDRIARRWGYAHEGGMKVWFELGNPVGAAAARP